MAFLTNGTTTISFAEYDDVVSADQRLFEANEGLTDDVIEDQLIRSTARILTLFRSTDWWRSYYITRSTNFTANTVADIPALDPNRIEDRLADFTDLCVYYALYNYILPKIADFSTEDNAERAKIGFYQAKFDRLFGELIAAGDWYNFDGSGAITSAEKQPGYYNLKRVR
jgi:hypothetical protein